MKNAVPAAVRSRLFVTASTPWAIRNFFHTGIIERLARNYEVIVFTTPTLECALKREGYTRYVRTVVFDHAEEPRLWKWSRQIRKKLYFEMRSTATEALWHKYGGRPWVHRMGGRIIAATSRVVSAPRALSWLSTLDGWLNRSQVFAELFSESKNALLFSTYTNCYFEDAILRSAHAQRIPAVLMILSWDHISTKVVLSPIYQKILVWTDLQKAEILATYPWVKAEQIGVTGVPQFDGYSTPTETTKTAFCARYGLDPQKRTLVYYSMPQVRHCHQHIILEAMAEAIAAGDSLPSNLQILIKCHPFDDYSLYEPIAERYAHVAIQRTTLLPGSDPLTWIPNASEMEISKDILTFADVTVNIYSTVTVEAAYFDKPIVHIAFDAGDLPAGRIPCREYYNFTHFKPIVDTGASTLAYSQAELHTAVCEALAHPEYRRESRRVLSAAWTGPMDGCAGERVVNEIRAMTSGLQAQPTPFRKARIA